MKKILITEDDRFLAKICRRMFEDGGYGVTLAHDGRAAIAALETDPPDIALLDLNLPEIDGVGVLRAIREDPRLRHMPVLVVSNSSYFAGIVQSAWHAGATNFINKGDCSPKGLVEEADRLVSRAAPPDPAARPTPIDYRPLPEKSGTTIPRVLIADDDRTIHGVLSFFLGEAGLKVLSAFDGEDALRVVEKERPDAMILDETMPRLDGMGVLLKLRDMPRLPPVPTLMLTGRNSDRLRREALDAGAAEFAVKPFSPDFVVQRTRALVGW